jgi:hypothetical protein
MYRQLIERHPETSETDILTMLYLARAEAGRNITGHAGEWYRKSLPSDARSVERFRSNPSLSIRDLIIRIVDAEDPKSPLRPMELRFTILDVVDNALDQEFPGWRARSRRSAN